MYMHTYLRLVLTDMDISSVRRDSLSPSAIRDYPGGSTSESRNIKKPEVQQRKPHAHAGNCSQHAAEEGCVKVYIKPRSLNSRGYINPPSLQSDSLDRLHSIVDNGSLLALGAAVTGDCHKCVHLLLSLVILVPPAW